MTTTDKGLKDKAVKIKWKDYVQVKDRLQYLSDNYDGRYELESQYDYFPERKMWVVKATLTIWDEKHENSCIYEWLAQEVESENYKEVNFSSALENCQTSARWRAAAARWCWIETTWWIASANEMQKALNRQKVIDEVVDWPFTDTPSNPEPTWFQKAISNTKFMQECMSEEDFIAKIKWKYEVDEIVESQLRDAYKNANNIDSEPSELPFN